MTAPRVRFAPSPTGYLHIGGVRTALFNWLWARKTGGAFVLRIEDTDQVRSTPESRQVILDSLSWLGLDWDEGPNVAGAHGPYTQMERLALYTEHAERLVTEGKAYRCYCTKEELEQARERLKASDPKAQFKYPGTCRDRKDQPDLPFVVRYRADTSGEVTYVDKVFGEVRTPNKELLDFVLLRSDGIPLYNFGAVVDDMTMQISLVARGRDHMINTPPQILLYQAFGAKVPDFAHLPMMLNQKGAKLSKRDGAVGVFEYRDKGYTPMGVMNYLVRFGWSHGDQEIFSRAGLIEAFSWEGCSRADGKFDPKKFTAIQQEQLKSAELTPDAEYTEGMMPFLVARGLAANPETVRAALPLLRDRAQTLEEAASMLDYVFRDPPELDEKAAAKFLVPAVAPRLSALRAAFAATSAWQAAPLEAAMQAYLDAEQLTIKDVAQAARVALTGRSASPGLFDVMVLLGRERSLARLDAAAARAAQTS